MDARGDILAFGMVFYEMLTGTKSGDEPASDLSDLQTAVPTRASP
jgi:hypothetical protein